MTDTKPATMTLDACPPGLFEFGNERALCFKSQYALGKIENGRAVGLQCDAYIVSSGEYFWGGTSDWRVRAQLKVTPINVYKLTAHIDAERARAERAEARVKALEDALRQHVIILQQRMTRERGLVDVGHYCDLCDAEWDMDVPEHHADNCVLKEPTNA